jgi:hypothetical protein
MAGVISSPDRHLGGNTMRLFVTSLIVISVLYYWDAAYNNGTLVDGLRSMGRSMSHSMGR